MAIYRRKCDQCHNEFKRGLRMDLLISQATVMSGEIRWNPDEDMEHFASFCSKECLVSYIAQQLGLE
jgi:hypothetical protein